MTSNLISLFPAESVSSLVDAALKRLGFSHSVEIIKKETREWCFVYSKHKMISVKMVSNNCYEIYRWKIIGPSQTGYFDYYKLVQHPYDVAREIVMYLTTFEIDAAMDPIIEQWKQEEKATATEAEKAWENGQIEEVYVNLGEDHF